MLPVRYFVPERFPLCLSLALLPRRVVVPVQTYWEPSGAAPEQAWHTAPICHSAGPSTWERWAADTAVLCLQKICLVVNLFILQCIILEKVLGKAELKLRINRDAWRFEISRATFSKLCASSFLRTVFDERRNSFCRNPKVYFFLFPFSSLIYFSAKGSTSRWVAVGLCLPWISIRLFSCFRADLPGL